MSVSKYLNFYWVYTRVLNVSVTDLSWNMNVNDV